MLISASVLHVPTANSLSVFPLFSKHQWALTRWGVWATVGVTRSYIVGEQFWKRCLIKTHEAGQFYKS